MHREEDVLEPERLDLDDAIELALQSSLRAGCQSPTVTATVRPEPVEDSCPGRASASGRSRCARRCRRTTDSFSASSSPRQTISPSRRIHTWLATRSMSLTMCEE